MIGDTVDQHRAATPRPERRVTQANPCDSPRPKPPVWTWPKALTPSASQLLLSGVCHLLGEDQFGEHLAGRDHRLHRKKSGTKDHRHLLAPPGTMRRTSTRTLDPSTWLCNQKNYYYAMRSGCYSMKYVREMKIFGWAGPGDGGGSPGADRPWISRSRTEVIRRWELRLLESTPIT